MTLTDAGPLVALIDRNDQDHDRCVEALSRLVTPFVTTWPALAEAMYLLGDRVGWPGQQALWETLLGGELIARAPDDPGLRRAFELMRKYKDVPMAFADATLVALAEELNTRRIFTVDQDFTIYRTHGRVAFEIVPCPNSSND